MVTDLILQKRVAKPKQETLKRSLLKTISWRVIGTLDTVVIAYLITDRVNEALTIGGIELISKMVLYFFHERTWNTIRWGKNS